MCGGPCGLWAKLLGDMRPLGRMAWGAEEARPVGAEKLLFSSPLQPIHAQAFQRARLEETSRDREIHRAFGMVDGGPSWGRMECHACPNLASLNIARARSSWSDTTTTAGCTHLGLALRFGVPRQCFRIL